MSIKRGFVPHFHCGRCGRCGRSKLFKFERKTSLFLPHFHMWKMWKMWNTSCFDTLLVYRCDFDHFFVVQKPIFIKTKLFNGGTQNVDQKIKIFLVIMKYSFITYAEDLLYYIMADLFLRKTCFFIAFFQFF